MTQYSKVPRLQLPTLTSLENAEIRGTKPGHNKATSIHSTEMPNFFRQVVDMRYTDSEILAQELDRRLGSKDWKCEVRVVKDLTD